MLYQIGVLEAFARSAGTRVSYVKPSGRATKEMQNGAAEPTASLSRGLGPAWWCIWQWRRSPRESARPGSPAPAGGDVFESLRRIEQAGGVVEPHVQVSLSLASANERGPVSRHDIDATHRARGMLLERDVRSRCGRGPEDVVEEAVEPESEPVLVLLLAEGLEIGLDPEDLAVVSDADDLVPRP